MRSRKPASRSRYPFAVREGRKFNEPNYAVGSSAYIGELALSEIEVADSLRELKRIRKHYMGRGGLFDKKVDEVEEIREVVQDVWDEKRLEF